MDEKITKESALEEIIKIQLSIDLLLNKVIDQKAIYRSLQNSWDYLEYAKKFIERLIDENQN